jgi:glycosyltransferase involved in cell wall biosynthesis
VDVIEPSQFKSIKCPGYNEIPLCYNTGDFLCKYKGIDDVAFHVATEGPLGFKATKLLKKHKWDFSSSFCTMFPDYLKEYYNVPTWISWAAMRYIHRNSSSVMVSTETMRKILKKNKFKNNIRLWPRAVDTTLFKIPSKIIHSQLPIALYVGRISYEKNLPAFLDADVNFTKILVGDGPARKDLEARYPRAIFTGALTGSNLVSMYQQADVFVFPSKSDTFGLVMLEALACGVPIAAYPVQGPKDILPLFCQSDGACGVMDHDLEMAIEAAYKYGKKESCRKLAEQYNWLSCTEKFLSNLKFIST